MLTIQVHGSFSEEVLVELLKDIQSVINKRTEARVETIKSNCQLHNAGFSSHQYILILGTDKHEVRSIIRELAEIKICLDVAYLILDGHYKSTEMR